MKKPIASLEVWQRGPVPGIPAQLQPIAHALLQAKEEMYALMDGFPDNLLWEKPAGLASPAFHLQHMSGVIDRLFTYAKGKSLDTEQLETLVKEGKEDPGISVQSLLETFDECLARALADLAFTDPATLTDFRGVGRAQLPSTVIGLLMHSAEHTMRHLGQLIVTIKVLQETGKRG